MNKNYFFQKAYTANGWMDNVSISVGGDGLIEALAPNSSPQTGATEFSGFAIPAMSNAHSHAFQRGFAGLGEHKQKGNPDSFWSWRDKIYGFVTHLTPDDILAIARQTYVEMLKGGYAQVAEFHYLHNAADGTPYDDMAIMSKAHIEAASNVGIGLSMAPILYQRAGFDDAPLNSAQQRFHLSVDDYIKLYEGLDSPQKAIGFHSLRAVSLQNIKKVLSAKLKPQAIHIHIAEQQKEVDDCVAHHQVRPIDYLFKNIDVDERWCLVHATHASEQEVSVMAYEHAVVALCPTTEANLGDGIFPTPEYLSHKGRFALGSDSHVSLSATEELRQLEYVERLRKKSRIILGDGTFLWNGAAKGGAQICGGTGALEMGARGDILVLDEKHPSLASGGDESIFDRFIFTSHGTMINHVISGGLWCIKHGKHKDEENILTNYNKTIKTLLEKM